MFFQLALGAHDAFYAHVRKQQTHPHEPCCDSASSSRSCEGWIDETSAASRCEKSTISCPSGSQPAPDVISCPMSGDVGCRTSESSTFTTKHPALSYLQSSTAVNNINGLPEARSLEKETDALWVYPSQQQFFNAMKSKHHDPKQDDMAVVVSMHNAVNEMTWKKILEWEKRYSDSCAAPKLLKFEGKPREVSLRARWNNLFGAKLPFDRHDWVVDRCGQEIPYIIDFYQGKSEGNALVSMYLDVRPDMKSLQGIQDRLLNWTENGWQSVRNRWNLLFE